MVLRGGHWQAGDRLVAVNEFDARSANQAATEAFLYNDFDINSTRRSSLASTDAVAAVQGAAWSASLHYHTITLSHYHTARRFVRADWW